MEPPNKFVAKRLVRFVRQKREIPPRIGTGTVSMSFWEQYLMEKEKCGKLTDV
jgi:hypothetical protein